MLKSKRQIIIALMLSAMLVAPLFVRAAGLVPCGGPTEDPCKVEDIFILIARVTNWLIAVAGVFAVFEIFNSAFWMITTMGNEEKITKYRQAITNSVVGFVVAMLAFLFVNTAVNLLLSHRCPINLASPLTYLNIDPNTCKK